MSSYQLDILDKMKFDVGIVLNITPDHLDRYGNIENYIVSKQIQIKRVKPNGLKIMGIDTSYSMQAYKHLLNVGHTDIVPISALQVLPKGIYAKDNKVYSSEQGTEVLLGTIPDILPGAHNAENVMAAMLACRFVGMDTSEFFKLLPLYQGLEHRQERVLETEKVLCINDSKATNADATLPALKTYKNIYWIVGGIAKEEGVIPLLSYLNNVEKILLIGESASRFQEELKPVSNKIITVDTLESAVAFIEKELNVIDHKITVLLSPTCASQDQFQNFEHRGKVFKALVQERFRVS
jgi:UDP-N-acetylmuramoylalanine--D-glutamate ligase